MTPISRVNRNVVVRVRLGQEMLNIHGLGWVGLGMVGSARLRRPSNVTSRVGSPILAGGVESGQHISIFSLVRSGQLGQPDAT